MSQKIYREHHGLHPETGELQPGMQEHQGEGCQCKDCKAHRAGTKAPAAPVQKTAAKPKRKAQPKKKAPVQPALPGAEAQQN